MSLLPDPGHLYATADRIARHADALRARASALVAAAGRARWYSPAAAQFRAQTYGIAVRMRQRAARLDDASDALRRHAHRVETELAVAVRAAVAVEHGVEQAATTVEHVGGRVLSAIGIG